MKRANTGIGSGGDDLQCVAPDHNNQMGDPAESGADVTVSSGAANESDVAPADGIVVISIPAITVRLRIGASVTATANDQAYFGADTLHMPITAGDVVSLYGDGGTGTATVSMAK